jgi:hypothetical protein
LFSGLQLSQTNEVERKSKVTSNGTARLATTKGAQQQQVFSWKKAISHPIKSENTKTHYWPVMISQSADMDRC